MLMGELRKIRWTWQSRDNDLRVAYMAVDGRISIADLIDRMTELAPGVDMADVHINWATVVWTRPATADELTCREEANRRDNERHEQWERQTYDRLKKKYGDS